jgi:hypothetical protein
MGFDEASKTLVEAMERSQRIGGIISEGKITEPGQVQSMSDAMDYVQYTVGNLTPTAAEVILASIASGGVGGIAGRTAAKKALKKWVEKRALSRPEKEIVEESLQRLTERGLRQGTIQGRTIGGTAGGFGASYQMGVGDIYGETIEAGEGRPDIAFAGAVPYAAAEFLPYALGARRFIGPLLGKKAGERSFRQFGRNLLAAEAEQIPTEAATEYLQEEELIQIRAALDPSFDPRGEEAGKRRVSALAAGGIGGATFGLGGAVAQTLGGKPGDPDIDPKDPKNLLDEGGTAEEYDIGPPVVIPPGDESGGIVIGGPAPRDPRPADVTSEEAYDRMGGGFEAAVRAQNEGMADAIIEGQPEEAVLEGIGPEMRQEVYAIIEEKTGVPYEPEPVEEPVNPALRDLVDAQDEMEAATSERSAVNSRIGKDATPEQEAEWEAADDRVKAAAERLRKAEESYKASKQQDAPLPSTAEIIDEMAMLMGNKDIEVPAQQELEKAMDVFKQAVATGQEATPAEKRAVMGIMAEMQDLEQRPLEPPTEVSVTPERKAELTAKAEEAQSKILQEQRAEAEAERELEDKKVRSKETAEAKKLGQGLDKEMRRFNEQMDAFAFTKEELDTFAGENKDLFDQMEAAIKSEVPGQVRTASDMILKKARNRRRKLTRQAGGRPIEIDETAMERLNRVAAELAGEPIEEPAAPAVAASVVFPDPYDMTRDEFLRGTPAPRARGGHRLLYHVTSNRNAASIVRRGLKAKGGEIWASKKPDGFYGKGEPGAVVVFQVPKDDPLVRGAGVSMVVHRDVGFEDIVMVDPYIEETGKRLSELRDGRYAEKYWDKYFDGAEKRAAAESAAEPVATAEPSRAGRPRMAMTKAQADAEARERTVSKQVKDRLYEGGGIYVKKGETSMAREILDAVPNGYAMGWITTDRSKSRIGSWDQALQNLIAEGILPPESGLDALLDALRGRVDKKADFAVERDSLRAESGVRVSGLAPADQVAFSEENVMTVVDVADDGTVTMIGDDEVVYTSKRGEVIEGAWDAGKMKEAEFDEFLAENAQLLPLPADPDITFDFGIEPEAEPEAKTFPWDGSSVQDEMRWYGTEVEVSPSSIDVRAGVGEVQRGIVTRVLNGGEMVEVQFEGNDFSNRIGEPQRLTVTSLKDAAEFQAEYEKRYAARVEKIKAAESAEDVDAILQEEYADDQRHMEGTNAVESAAKSRKSEIEYEEGWRKRQEDYDAGKWVVSPPGSNTIGYGSERQALAEMHALQREDNEHEYRVYLSWTPQGERYYMEYRKVPAADLSQVSTGGAISIMSYDTPFVFARKDGENLSVFVNVDGVEMVLPSGRISGVEIIDPPEDYVAETMARWPDSFGDEVQEAIADITADDDQGFSGEQGDIDAEMDKNKSQLDEENREDPPPPVAPAPLITDERAAELQEMLNRWYGDDSSAIKDIRAAAKELIPGIKDEMALDVVTKAAHGQLTEAYIQRMKDEGRVTQPQPPEGESTLFSSKGLDALKGLKKKKAPKKEPTPEPDAPELLAAEDDYSESKTKIGAFNNRFSKVLPPKNAEEVAVNAALSKLADVDSDIEAGSISPAEAIERVNKVIADAEKLIKDKAPKTADRVEFMGDELEMDAEEKLPGLTQEDLDRLQRLEDELGDDPLLSLGLSPERAVDLIKFGTSIYKAGLNTFERWSNFILERMQRVADKIRPFLQSAYDFITMSQSGQLDIDDLSDDEFAALFQGGGFLAESEASDYAGWSERMTELAGEGYAPIFEPLYNTIRDFAGSVGADFAGRMETADQVSTITGSKSKRTKSGGRRAAGKQAAPKKARRRGRPEAPRIHGVKVKTIFENAALKITKIGRTQDQLIKGRTNSAHHEWFRNRGLAEKLDARWDEDKKGYVSSKSKEEIAQAIIDQEAGLLTGRVRFDSRGRSDQERERIAQLTRRLESESDTEFSADSIDEYVTPKTKELILRGVEFGVPEDVANNQIEDIAMVHRAYQKGKKMFLIANGAGSGKTYVLGGVIREIAKTIKERGGTDRVYIKYVTQSADLIDQVKKDLAAFDGIEDVEFVSYMELSNQFKSGVRPGALDVLIFDECHNVKMKPDSDSAQRAEMGAMMMRNAEFTILTSATPFENPVEARYLTPTGVFDGNGGFEDWAEAYGANRRIKQDGSSTVSWPRGQHRSGIAARNWFLRNRIMTQRPTVLPEGMVDTYMIRVGGDPDMTKKYRLIEELAYAAEGREAKGWYINTLKRMAEHVKADEAVRLAKEEGKSARAVVIFTESKSELNIGRFRWSKKYREEVIRSHGGMKLVPKDVRADLDRRWEWADLDRQYRQHLAAKEEAESNGQEPPISPFADFIHAIAQQLNNSGVDWKIPGSISKIVDGLGGTDVVAVYAGSAKKKKTVQPFLEGKYKYLVATMAKGGTGLSVHDTVGNRPTSQINVILPWTATVVDQVSGRIARYGMKSKAKIFWLFSDFVNMDSRILAPRVGARMRDMGASVQGVDSKLGGLLDAIGEDEDFNISDEGMAIPEDQYDPDAEAASFSLDRPKGYRYSTLKEYSDEAVRLKRERRYEEMREVLSEADDFYEGANRKSEKRVGRRGGMAHSEIRKRYDKATGKYGKALPELVIVDNHTELPFPAPSNANGAFWRGKIYLVAENMKNDRKVQRVVMHELITHFGLRQLLGAEINSVLDAVWTAYGQRGLQDIIDLYYDGKTRTFDPKNAADRRMVAEEKLAEMAEKIFDGSATSSMRRAWMKLVAKVKNLLRQMGMDINIGDAELAEILINSEAFLEGDPNSEYLTPAEPKFSKDRLVEAEKSPLYRVRAVENFNLPTDQEVNDALMDHGQSRKVIEKGLAINPGDLVGVRLNLNVLDSSGLTIQSMHPKSYTSGSVLGYELHPTIKDVTFAISQSGRDRIATGLSTKHRMASADGALVRTDAPNFDGVALRFNPKREHVFTDENGYPVKFVEEATVYGFRVYARGRIEYHSKATVPKPGVASTAREPLFSLDRFVEAEKSPLYEKRDASTVHIPTDREMEDALKVDGATIGARDASLKNQIEPGTKIGSRLQITVARKAGKFIQTIHRGSWSQKRLAYAQGVTLRKVDFGVSQQMREKIAQGKHRKTTMASANGELVSWDINLDGVALKFNPKREHLFTDENGFPVRFVEEATVFGNRVYARGRIEYHSKETVPKQEWKDRESGDIIVGTAPTAAKEPLFSLEKIREKEPLKFFHAVTSENLDQMAEVNNQLIAPSFGISRHTDKITEFGDTPIWDRDIWSPTMRDVPEKIYRIDRASKEYQIIREYGMANYLDKQVLRRHDAPSEFARVELSSDSGLYNDAESIAQRLGIEWDEDSTDVMHALANGAIKEIPKTPENIARWQKDALKERGQGAMFSGPQEAAQRVPFEKLPDIAKRKLVDQYSPDLGSTLREKQFNAVSEARDLFGIVSPDNDPFYSSRVFGDDFAGELAAMPFDGFKSEVNQWILSNSKFDVIPYKNLQKAHKALRDAFVDIKTDYFEAKSYDVFDVSDFDAVVTSNPAGIDKLAEMGFTGKIFDSWDSYYSDPESGYRGRTRHVYG